MIQDKVIIIVGATGGIGTALNRQLAPTGVKLVLAARNKVNLATLAEELSGEVLTVPTDITQSDQVNALIQATLTRFGQIDVLVNAVGIGILKPYNSIEPGELEKMLDLNLKGCFYTTQAAAQEMQKRKSGHMLFPMLYLLNLRLYQWKLIFNLIAICFSSYSCNVENQRLT